MKLKNIYISFFGNLIRTFVNYLSLFYLSRKLGPEISGQLNYLLSIFLALRMIFDPGYSNVFFSVISEETKDKKFYKFYFFLLFVQLALPILLFFLLPNSFVFKIWDTDDNLLLLLVFLIVFLQNSLWDFFSKVLESRRLFFQTQSIQITTNTLGLMSLVVLSNLGNLTLCNSVFVLLGQWIMASAFGLYCFTRIEFKTSDNPQTFVLWCRNLLKPTKPLILVSVFSFCTDFFDRWLLQNQFGSKEQSFFSYGLTIASVASLIGAGIFSVLWKEFSELNFTKNLEKMKSIYSRYYSILFVTTSFFCMYFVPWVSDIIQMTVGKQFSEAKSTVLVLLFLPIYQIVGRLNLVFLYATFRNNLILRMNLLSFILSILFSYLLIVPSDKIIPGMGLGALGLAAKTLIVNWVVVLIFKIIISKELNIKSRILFEFAIIFLFFLFSFFSFLFTKSLNFFSGQQFMTYIFSFLIYSSLIFSTIVIMRRVISEPYDFLLNFFRGLKINLRV